MLECYRVQIQIALTVNQGIAYIIQADLHISAIFDHGLQVGSNAVDPVTFMVHLPNSAAEMPPAAI